MECTILDSTNSNRYHFIVRREKRYLVGVLITSNRKEIIWDSGVPRDLDVNV